MANLKITRGATGVLLLALAALAFSRAAAQQTSPQFMITWQAASYAPPQFAGKILPTANSPIKASFNIIDNGKLADLSRQTIYWYAEDNLIAGGEGVQAISFAAPPSAPSTLDLRIQIPDYKGNIILKTIGIPIVRPEAVIEAPYSGAKFGNYSLSVSGVPYFFNVASPSALNFSWSVNGQAPTGAENPAQLNINLNQDAPLGSVINIGLAIQNPARMLEAALDNINLTLSR